MSLAAYDNNKIYFHQLVDFPMIGACGNISSPGLPVIALHEDL